MAVLSVEFSAAIGHTLDQLKPPAGRYRVFVSSLGSLNPTHEDTEDDAILFDPDTEVERRTDLPDAHRDQFAGDEDEGALDLGR